MVIPAIERKQAAKRAWQTKAAAAIIRTPRDRLIPEKRFPLNRLPAILFSRASVKGLNEWQALRGSNRVGRSGFMMGLATAGKSAWLA
jgi:hypothetical protein